MPDNASKKIQTAIGEATLWTMAGGYFQGIAIFVDFPGIGPSQKLADAFTKATDGEFTIEPAPCNSMGGDSRADAMIITRSDWHENSAPRLDDTAALLARLIDEYQDCFAV